MVAVGLNSGAQDGGIVEPDPGIGDYRECMSSVAGGSIGPRECAGGVNVYHCYRPTLSAERGNRGREELHDASHVFWFLTW